MKTSGIAVVACVLAVGCALSLRALRPRRSKRTQRKVYGSTSHGTLRSQPLLPGAEWMDFHGFMEDDISWGFCTVAVGHQIYVLGHHSERQYYGYGLPALMVYDCLTNGWHMPKLTGIPLIWWNIGWLDSPELLTSPSMQSIFSPFSFQIGNDTVTFDVLEVSTATWRQVQCALGPVNPAGCLYRFVHLHGFSVLALVYVYDPPEDGVADGASSDGYLSIRLLDLLAGTCQDIAYTGQAPPAWRLDTVPTVCYSAPCLYLFEDPGSNFSSTDCCPLYIFHLSQRCWKRIDHQPLPIPRDFPKDLLFPLDPFIAIPEDCPAFSRHFVAHAGRLTCDVTFHEQSRLYCLNTADPWTPTWAPLCDCNDFFGSADCYCTTSNTVYHLEPLTGHVMRCVELLVSQPVTGYRRCALQELTPELLLHFFSYLGPTILVVPHVCRLWRRIGMWDNDLMDATWDAVPLRDISHWNLVPLRFAELKLLLGSLDDYLYMAFPPEGLLQAIFSQRFRLEWQRPSSSCSQRPYQWCLSALLQTQGAVLAEEDAGAPKSCNVVVINCNGEEVLSEGQLTKLRYNPAPTSHFLMEMLHQLTYTPMAPNVVKPIYVMPDATVYAAYFSAREAPLVDIVEAKQQALGRLLREAPSLAIMNSQQLMDLAYVTASQPSRQQDEQEEWTLQEYQQQQASTLANLPFWRRLSLGDLMEGIDGPVVCFMLSKRRSLLLPYSIGDHVELFVK